MMEDGKPIHARPSYYAQIFFDLKEIAFRYGYNLVLHGSMNRDLDLIAIPWAKTVKSHINMIKAFYKYLGVKIYYTQVGKLHITEKPHGRIVHTINIYRGEKGKGDYHDPQYYLDISIILKHLNPKT